MIHPTDLIARHVTADIDTSDAILETCFVTGLQTLCIPRERAISEAFTDMRFCSSPLSPFVSVSVAVSWKHGHHLPGKKRIFCPERQSCWYADMNEFRQLTRADIRDLVLNGAPSVPWAGWATEKYRKHGSTRSQVNHTQYGIWGFDEHKPDCTNIDRVHDWYAHLTKYYMAGISRKTLMYGNVPAGLMHKIGVKTCLEFERWRNDKWLSDLYRFLIYLIPGRDNI